MDICKFRKLYNNEILSVLNSKKICNAAYINSSKDVEIIPVLYVFDNNDEKFTFYIIDINNDSNLQNNDTLTLFLEDYVLGFYIDAYKNVCIKGKVEIITNEKEKSDVLLKFKKKNSQNLICYKDSNLKLIKLNVNEVSGRQY